MSKYADGLMDRKYTGNHVAVLGVECSNSCFQRRELKLVALLRKLKFYDYIPDPVERENAVNSLIDGSLFAVMSGLTQPFWGAFAVQLGASDYMVGLLTSLPALMNLVSQVPSAVLIDRYDNRQRPTLRAAFVSRSFLLLFAFLAVAPLPPNVRAWSFILAYSIRSFPETMCNIAWTAMMGEMFNPRLRARIFAERNMVTTLISLNATIVAGQMLDIVPWPANFAFLYLLGYGFVMGSWYYLTRHKEVPLSKEERTNAPAGLKAFKAVRGDRMFLKFVAVLLIIYIGFDFTAALWTILWVKIMGLSNTWLGMFSITSGIMSFLTYKQWGRWLEKHGAQTVLLVTAGAHVIVPLVYGHSRSPYIHLLVHVLTGGFGAGLNLSIFNMLLDVTPDATRPAYVAVYNMALGLSSVVWPLVGVSLYQAIGMKRTLDIAFLIRMGVALAAGLFLRESRRQPEVV